MTLNHLHWFWKYHGEGGCLYLYNRAFQEPQCSISTILKFSTLCSRSMHEVGPYIFSTCPQLITKDLHNMFSSNFMSCFYDNPLRPVRAVHVCIVWGYPLRHGRNFTMGHTLTTWTVTVPLIKSWWQENVLVLRITKEKCTEAMLSWTHIG